jgi:hypothetical protein
MLVRSAAHIDAPDQLHHAIPQRKPDRQPFIEEAERPQQQKEDGQGRAASIDSSWPMMAARTFSSELPWRIWCSRKSACMWASQKTSRVATVAAGMRSGDLPGSGGGDHCGATIVP